MSEKALRLLRESLSEAMREVPMGSEWRQLAMEWSKVNLILLSAQEAHV